MKKIFLLLILILSIKCSIAQTSYVWNGATSTNWNTGTNWTPNGIPGSADNVTIVTGANNCVLAGNTTITNLTITSGVLNLNAFTLNTTGVVACNGGSCNNGTFNSTATTLTFAGTTFGANIIANVTEVYFNGSTFNGSVTTNKNGGTNAQSTGNNTFNGVTSITNSGTGYLMLTNGGAGRIDIFNNTTTLNTTNTGNLYLGYSRNININANFIINNTASTGSTFLGNNGVVNLNTGITISCGTSVGGSLNINKLVQTGSTALNLLPGNAGGVNITGSTINGILTVNAGIISAQTSTFAAAVTYSMAGTTSNVWSAGGNTYNGVLTVNNSSSGYFGFGNGTADTYNADVYANNTSTTGGRIIFGNSSNNQFNGNIYVSQSGTTNASGIALGWGGTFPVINLAAGKNILVNGVFSSGYLQLLRLQTAASTNINLTTTGTSNVTLNNNTFNGTVNVTTPDFYPNGGTYNGAVSFIKTGGTTGNHNNGNLNIFNSTLNLENQSSTGYILLGYNSADQFNDNITVTSSGTGGISFGWSGGTGTPTLAAGKTISIGSGGYSAGFLSFGSFTQLGSGTPINLPLTGTASFAVYKNTIPTLFNSSLNVTAADITIQGGTFNGATVFTKTGGTSNHNSGVQNIFNSTLTVNQQSNTGYFMLGYNSSDQFNDDITVTSTGTGGISFGWSGGTGTPTLAAGKTINIGPAGFSTGYLQLGSFTQLGSAPINLPMTGNSAFYVVNSSVPCAFGGDLTVTAADLYIRGGVFNGATSFTKTSGVDNHNNGNLNIFNSTLTINQQSTTGYIMFAYNSNDIYNGDITVTNTGTRGIYLGFSSGTGTPTLATGKTVIVGSAGFTGGFLYFGAFTQLGSAAMNLSLATAATLYFRASSMGGDVTSTSGSYWISGSTFNGAFNATKTGSPSDACPGGNFFNGTTTITNTGSGYFGFGWSLPDTWNGDVTFNNSGTERILPAWVAAGNLFNGNITLNSTGSSVGINFCGNNAVATATLAAGKTINTGTFNKGYLILQRFTQLGNAPVTLNLTPGSNYLTIAPNCTIGGSLTVVAESINNISTSTFNGPVSITKNAATSDSWSGGNTFNSTTNLINNGNNYLLLGNGTPDVFNGDVTFTNNGSDRILPSYNSVGNLYNGNITVNSTGSSTGIHFDAGGTATSTLAATKTIQIGGSGFTSGYLILPRFTQLGSAPISLTLPVGSNYITIGPNSAIGGNLTVVAQQINNILSSTFNGTVDMTKNGPSNDAWTGGNTFNSTSTITSNSTGYLLLGNGSPDIFNGDVIFTNNGSERILPAYNSIGNMFNGNIYVNTTGSAQGIQFCGGTSTATSTLAATKTIAAGSAGLNAGYLILKQFTQLGNAPITLTLTSTASYLQYGPLSSLGGNVTSLSPRVYFNGCTFNGTTNCTKNGAVDDDSNGANTFVGSSTITNTGSGRILLGNGNIDAFMSTATFNNLGSNHMYIAHNSANNTFGGVTTFNNAPSNSAYGIYVSGYSTGTVFNDNIIVTNINGAGVQFCYANATATSTLVTGKTITIGAAGFNSGTLLLKQFIQLGPTPQSFTTTGTSSIIQYGPLSSFGGNVTSVSPRVYFNGCTFNGTSNCTKNGAVDDDSNGSNTFVGASTITNYGSGRILLGNASTDAFMSTANFNNLGTNHMFIAHNSANNVFGGVTTFSNAPTGNYAIYVSGYSTGTIFNDNIIVSNVNGAGVQFCYGNATATSTLATGKTITIGSAGFNTGTLLLKQFTQLGSTAQTLSITTGNGLLQLGPISRFDGDVNFSFPQVLLNGTTYNGVTNITKNGASDNAGVGGNIFNGTTTINNTNSGYLMTGNGTSDQFNGVTTFNNTGSYRIYFAYNHAGQTTTFAQSTTLNSAKTSGADQWAYLIAESNNSNIRFDGDLTINTSGTIRSDLRTIAGASCIATYNGNVAVNLTNTHANTQITLGTTGTSLYNGNITLVNTGAGASGGVYFNTGATATSTMSNTKSIGLGASGFTGGTLSLIRYTQLGSTTQTLSQLTGTATIISGPTNTFNGDVNFNFPQVYLNGATYNGAATIQKNGATDNACVGNNIFNGTTTITNSHATNYFRMANTTADAYNGDVTFVQNNAGVIAPNYNTNCTYAGNVTISAPTSYIITFGSGGSGIATFNGGSAQTINKSGSVTNPVFTRLVISKTTNSVTLNTRINVSSALTLTQGIINTTSANILNMNDASTTTIGNSSSYINGPMNYDMALNGSRTLNLPIGKAADWRPAVLALKHSVATSYTYKAELTNADAQGLGYVRPVTANVISQIHWWDIDRTTTSTGVATPSANLSGNQTITLYYGTNDVVTDPAFLTIVKNTYTAGTTWFDIGGSGATAGSGNVTSTSAPAAFTSFSRFTLANKVGGTNPLPIELLSFTAQPVDKTVSLDWATATEVNNSHYDVERSADGNNFEFVTTVNAYGNGNSLNKQTYNAIDKNPYKGISYYRLKQVDKNGSFTYTQVVSVEFTTESYVNIFPNPASNVLMIKASDNYSNAKLKIISSIGVEVILNAQLNSYNGIIDVSHLATGIYYVVIENGNATENIKISIQ